MILPVLGKFRPARVVGLLQECVHCQQRRSLAIDGSRGVNLAYYTYENLKVQTQPELHPLIILHGMMGSKSNWQSLVKVFGRTGRKVVALDARNHGESVHVEEMSYFLFRDDLLRFMDMEEIDQAILLGHSMGGKTSMVTALTHPERVAGLIIEDVAPTASPSAGPVPAFLQAMLKIKVMLLDAEPGTQLSKARQVAIEELAKTGIDKATQHFLAGNLTLKDDRFTWKCNLDTIINTFPVLAHFPEFEKQPYEGKTLFVGGSKSQYIREDHTPLILSLFPAAKIVHVPDAGHWIHSEKPHEFINVVNTFLQEEHL